MTNQLILFLLDSSMTCVYMLAFVSMLTSFISFLDIYISHKE